MTLDQFTTFMAWSTAINLALLLIAALAVMLLGNWISGLHGQMFRMEPADVRRAYFGYIGTYKILIIVFFVAPYLALRFGMG
ncbi:MAG: DUF6868 family protein [Pseudomonadota bacterium]